jgi:hypothetical protein
MLKKHIYVQAEQGSSIWHVICGLTGPEIELIQLENRYHKEDMLMTAEQVTLVQDSWAKVTPIAETAAELFYGRLFETAPDVKP